MAQREDELIVLGRISGLYGVQGWVKVFSHTDPKENILHYSPWYVRRGREWVSMTSDAGRVHGKGLVSHLAGCDDRDAAAALVGSEIAVEREQLPPLPPDQFYWADLVGLQVRTVDGADLGVVDHLLETGANDVLVVRGERERLIPCVWGDVVVEVDLDRGTMQVDWDPDF